MNLKYLIREYKWATTPILYILLIVVASLVYTNKNSNHEITNGIIALKGGNIDDELNSIKEIKISKNNDIFDIEYFHDKKIVYVPSNSI